MTEHASCYWRGREEPRALRRRHLDDCADPDECRGCLPCTARHCVICGITHVDQQTCPECVGVTRTNLKDLRNLFAQLPAQALHGGVDGRLEAARPIPGGEATALMAPASNGRAVAWARERGDDVTHQQDERVGELDPPELMLVTWEDDWRLTRRTEMNDHPTFLDAVDYLGEHLTWAAQHHEAFDAFAEDLRAQVAKLEDVLHAGERADRTVPCLWCNGKIERVYDRRKGFSDTYSCLGRCKRKYTREQYLNAVRAGYLARSDKLTAADAAIRLNIAATRIRVWGSRYPELKAGKNEQGLWLYKVSAIEERMKTDERGDVA